MKHEDLHLFFGEPVYSVTWRLEGGVEAGFLVHDMGDESGLLLTSFGKTAEVTLLMSDNDAFHLASAIYGHLDKKLLGGRTP